MTNNEKTIEPKVYGLLLESRETNFLSIQYAYSLEEAFILAKLEFETLNPSRTGYRNPMVGAKISLFSVKSIGELMASPNLLQEILQKERELEKTKGIPIEQGPHNAQAPIIKPVEEIMEDRISKKNQLMQEIIQHKDIAKFEQNKEMFTKAERAYLKAQIK